MVLPIEGGDVRASQSASAFKAQEVESAKIVCLAQRELARTVLSIDREEFGGDNLTAVCAFEAVEMVGTTECTHELACQGFATFLADADIASGRLSTTSASIALILVAYGTLSARATIGGLSGIAVILLFDGVAIRSGIAIPGICARLVILVLRGSDDISGGANLVVTIRSRHVSWISYNRSWQFRRASARSYVLQQVVWEMLAQS